MNIGQADLWWYSLSASDKNLFLLNLQSFMLDTASAGREVGIYSASMLQALEMLEVNGESSLLRAGACAVADGMHASITNFISQNFENSEADIIATINIVLLKAASDVDYGDPAVSAKLLNLFFMITWTTHIQESDTLRMVDNSCLNLEFAIPLKCVDFSHYELSRPMEIRKC